MEMVRNAKELRNAIQNAKSSIINLDSANPTEYIAMLIDENNDLDSLQLVSKTLKIRLAQFDIFNRKLLAKKIAEFLINNKGRELEPNDEIGNVIKMAQRLDLKMGDLVGTK